MIPIHQAIGQPIKCPECGATALVRPSKARVATNSPQSSQITSAAKWCLVDCPKSGKKLYPQGTAVEVMEPPRVRPA